MDGIENSTSNAISLFDHKLDQAYAEVEAAVSAGTLGTPGQMGSLSRRNSYFFGDDAAYFSSSPLSASPLNTGNNRASFSRPPIPPNWLNLQPCEKVLEQTNETTLDVPTNPRRKGSGNSESSCDNNNNVKRGSSNGRRLRKPSNGPSTPSTPKDEIFSFRTAGVQLSSSRRSLLRDGSKIHSHSRQSSSTSMGFHLESGGDGPHDSGYFSSGDKRRSQSTSVTSTTSEREERALLSHHTHTRSETPTGDKVFDRLSKSQSSVTRLKTPTGDSVFDRLSKSQTHSSSAKRYNALERRREEYGESPELKVQA
ncbi:hypothetical protein GLOIN_2v841758 [Rhizophagus irregularis DAOM 181602=DAOM 197198]|nr:hypothetical protein GLOIN_2v841758 [Rhizophagus irregularis DAOM 181602=DAOM 197198]